MHSAHSKNKRLCFKKLQLATAVFLWRSSMCAHLYSCHWSRSRSSEAQTSSLQLCPPIGGSNVEERSLNSPWLCYDTSVLEKSVRPHGLVIYFRSLLDYQVWSRMWRSVIQCWKLVLVSRFYQKLRWNSTSRPRFHQQTSKDRVYLTLHSGKKNPRYLNSPLTQVSNAS